MALSLQSSERPRLPLFLILSLLLSALESLLFRFLSSPLSFRYIEVPQGQGKPR